MSQLARQVPKKPKKKKSDAAVDGAPIQEGRQVLTHSVKRRGSPAAGLVLPGFCPFSDVFRAQGLDRGLGPTAVDNNQKCQDIQYIK